MTADNELNSPFVREKKFRLKVELFLYAFETETLENDGSTVEPTPLMQRYQVLCDALGTTPRLSLKKES